MVKKSINRFAILSKLSKLENDFKKELARTFLEYLETLSFQKRVQEMESLLYETEVKRFVTFDKRLSKQEKKCLLLAKKGKSIKETAKILHLSYETVREYRASAIKKLESANLPSAVAVGIKYSAICNEVG